MPGAQEIKREKKMTDKSNRWQSRDVLESSYKDFVRCAMQSSRPAVIVEVTHLCGRCPQTSLCGVAVGLAPLWRVLASTRLRHLAARDWSRAEIGGDQKGGGNY